MNKSALLLSLLALLMLAACQVDTSARKPQPAQPAETEPVQAAVFQPPNIVLIVADDLGFTDLGVFGGEIETPNLDALAMSGVRLSNFHTAASCAPTRAMLLTGTDNHLAGVGSQAGLATPMQAQHRAYSNFLLPEVPTIAERLQALGYRTYISAKWHIGRELEALPAQRGFDRSLVLLEGGGGHFDDMALLERYDKATWLEGNDAVQLPEDFYSSDYMTDKLLTYINSTPAQQPYFAYLGFTAPHWPLQAWPADIQKYQGRYDHGWDELRRQRMAGAAAAGVVPTTARAVDFEAGMQPWDSLSAQDQQRASAHMAVYAAMVDRLDQNVGRLVAELRRRGDFANTMFVFMSDNGAEAHRMEIVANRNGWVDKHFDNALENIGTARSYVTLGPGWARAGAVPFRASKSKISEGGIRVPAFVRLPQAGAHTAVDGGHVDNTYMRVMDWAPTFVQLAGGTASGMMGRSLLDRLRGGPPPYQSSEVIAAELYGRRMAQRGPWKLLLQEAPYGTGEWQLYNLDNDQGEQNDVSDSFPEIRNELIQAWQDYADEVGVVLPETPIYY